MSKCAIEFSNCYRNGCIFKLFTVIGMFLIIVVYFVIGMTDDVGRTRGGRESRSHGSARREAAKVHRNTRQTKGKSVIVEPESEDDNVEEQQFEDEHEVDIGQQASEHEDEQEVEDEMEVADDVEDEMEVADDVEDEMEVAEEQTPPPPEKKSRKKNPRTTQGRNPPPVSEPPVTSYDGGPKELSLLPGFGKHVAVAICDTI
ncbi:acidic leucine-rich nuclear phosphoprotein 32 family member B-like [Trifolium pratense]|uniref:acidic leucine-rich nuclear phosphoprotein 32 family member B-like n=1 Tax=Trifolium pratense TaxID=57577 RepID=UPI001E691ADB|nr:acidic leucine-rich nuclear phosphoprotein 32 family member B-like [Trifolium pratense]